MKNREKENIQRIAESVKKSLGLSKGAEGKEGKEARKFTREDRSFILGMVGLTFLFSVRGGEMPGAVLATLQQVFVSLFYGLGTIFLLIGVTKKMFKYNPDRVQIVKWAVVLAVFFAMSQFLHEGFLMYTGQVAPHP